MKIIPSKYINIFQLLRNETRSLDELIHLQTIALRKLVNHAYDTVKFYKKLFDGCGLNPNDIQSLEDIKKIPIIDKKILNQYSYEDLISKEYRGNNLIIVKTAGSNGMPFMFFIDHPFDQLRKAQFLRPYLTNGKHLFDRSVSFSVHDTLKKKLTTFPEKKDLLVYLAGTYLILKSKVHFMLAKFK